MPVVARAGVSLYYDEVGSGPPVLWHTGGGGDGSMWRAAGYIDRLPGRRHLLFDHRGHGRSDQPTEVAAHRQDEYLADVLAVLDHAGVDQASLVGYSDGAEIAFAFAARHPDRVVAVVGVGGVPAPGSTNTGRAAAAAEIRRTGIGNVLAEISASESEPAPAWLMDNLAATPTEMFVLELEGWADAPASCEHFAQIQAPTLIVCGERENTDHATDAAVAALPDGAAVVLPGLGHLQAFYRTDLTVPVIREFLDRRVPVTG
jgi:pimeloyl-ACP methyl ester carboxylesterase